MNLQSHLLASRRSLKPKEYGTVSKTWDPDCLQETYVPGSLHEEIVRMVLNKLKSYDFVEILPLEIVEEIFKTLSSRDLVQCSLVSVKWREIVNSNRLWANLCRQENLQEKEPLQIENSYFVNPTKRFRPVKNGSENLSEICHWRSHYDRYKFLARNWRKGYCALHRLDLSDHVRPTFYNDGILVVAMEYSLTIVDTNRLNENPCEVPIKNCSWPIEGVIVSRNFIIYGQGKSVVGLRRTGMNTFVEEYTVKLGTARPPPLIPFVFLIGEKKRDIRMRKTENYLIVHEKDMGANFLILNASNGKEERIVDFEKHRGKCPLVCDYIQVCSFKTYIAFTSGSCYFIYEYDLLKNEWGAKFSVPFKVHKLYATKEVLCAKLRDKIEDIYYLHIWSLKDQSEVSSITLKENKPVALINDVVIYCIGGTIHVQSGQTSLQSKFKLATEFVLNMFAVGNYLVINTGDSIEVYDWGTGEKLYSPYRGICSKSLWADDKVIIITRWSCHYQIIGFW